MMRTEPKHRKNTGNSPSMKRVQQGKISGAIKAHTLGRAYKTKNLLVEPNKVE